MAKYSVTEIKNKSHWEKFVLASNPSTFLQSWNWAEVQRMQGKKIFRWGIKSGNKLVGICLIVKETARRGPHLLIPAGPVLNWQDRKLVDFFIKEIRKLAQNEKVWFIRIRPELKDSETNKFLFNNYGFNPSPMHVHAENTWILEIDKEQDELLAGMRKTTRYLIKKSQQEKFKLNISKDPKLSKLLFDLQAETEKRHGFVGFSQKVFESEIKLFAGDDQARVFVCEYEGRPLAAAIIIFYGNSAYYHYSGSVSDYDKIPFSYFLQWEIIKEAKKRGLKYYNFWGISPPGKTDHRFAGVTLFKTGFGGTRIDWLHARDLPISKLYWLNSLFEQVRRSYRHL
jgi:lipid II:glycine glycyltransferase (peptidoglycan interpeptide bridge formation enzyme)